MPSSSGILCLVSSESLTNLLNKDVPFKWTRLAIDTGSALPIREEPYRVAPSERKVIAEQLQEMLAEKIYRGHLTPGQDRLYSLFSQLKLLLTSGPTLSFRRISPN